VCGIKDVKKLMNYSNLERAEGHDTGDGS